MVNADLDQQLLGVVLGHSTLCLNVGDPGWDDARGYTIDPETTTMYFPVSKEFLDGRDLAAFSVLIWSNPRVIVTGRLSSATTDADVAIQLRILLSRGWEPDKAEYSLLDARNHKPRKNRHKLAVTDLRRPQISVEEVMVTAAIQPIGQRDLPMLDILEMSDRERPTR